MKSLVLTVFTLASIFANAETPVGKMTMKLGDDVTVNQAVLKKEITALETQIAEVSVELNQLDRDAQVLSPMIAPGLTNTRDGFSAIRSGLQIERAQLMQQRRALLADSLTAVP